MAQTAAAERTGRVAQVIGPVIDIEFTGGLPEIYNAVRIVSDGGPGVEKIDVVAEVEQHLGENRVRAVAMSTAREGRWGSREAEILGVDFLRHDGTVAHVFESGEPVEIRLHVRANQRLTDFVFGIGIFSAEGVCCYGTNTDIEGAQPGEFSGEANVGFHLDSLSLIEGSYKVDVAVHRRDGTPYDYHRQLHTIRVASHAVRRARP